MKNLILLTTLSLLATAGAAQAQSAGAFGFGIELKGTGGKALNSGVTTLYALDNNGTTRLLPTGSSATLSTAWTASSTSAAPTFSLGTFNLNDALVLDGGSFLTFKNNGGNVTATSLTYRVNAGTTGTGAFSPAVNLPFNFDNVNGSNGDQRWSLETGTTNLLAGLLPGTYTLSVFGSATATPANFFESNNSANYAATFTVVPEPGTWALMMGGLGVLVVFQRVRRLRLN